MLIQLRQISKSYHAGEVEVPVLQDLDLAIDRGEYVALMGPSGSGKSTLMNIIGCLDTPTTGTYTLNGRRVTGLGSDEIARTRNREIGFVFQQFNLMPHVNALKNVALPAVFAGEAPKTRRVRAGQLLVRVGMGHYLHHKPGELSGGQQQRVAIARALMNGPSLLLADEPTGALDSRSGEVILALFDELNTQGVTIVMITHAPEVARRAGRVLHILDGRLTAGGQQAAKAPGSGNAR